MSGTSTSRGIHELLREAPAPPDAAGDGSAPGWSAQRTLPLRVEIARQWRRRRTQVVLAGLALSALGDALLLSSRERTFLLGIASFLLAHVAYAVAFAPAARVSVPAAAALSLLAVGVVRWLWPHLGTFRLPVVAYAVAITAMLLLAVGVASPLVRAGAALFYVSDLTVARDRFVRRGLVNRLVGLPLYYAAQVLLALSAGGT